MDAAEPKGTRQDGFSININAPCTNRIAGRDYFEVNIHLGGRSEDPHDLQGKDHASSGEEEIAEAHDLGSDTVEVLVPRALRIARQIRSAESSAP